MSRKKFQVTFSVTVDVEVEQDILDEALSKDWAKTFYDLGSQEAVAEHLAYNHLRNHVTDISTLDGFAHRKEEDVVFSNESWDDPEAEELG